MDISLVVSNFRQRPFACGSTGPVRISMSWLPAGGLGSGTSVCSRVGIGPGQPVGLVAVFLAGRSVAYVHPISVPSPSDPEL